MVYISSLMFRLFVVMAMDPLPPSKMFPNISNPAVMVRQRPDGVNQKLEDSQDIDLELEHLLGMRVNKNVLPPMDIEALEVHLVKEDGKMDSML